MEYYIIIPAHNEAEFLAGTLDSVVAQSLPPKKVIVVNDHSTDDTEGIIDGYVKKHPFIQKRNRHSSEQHMPGSKVIQTFNYGLELLDDAYDFLVKLDADIILPPDYFKHIARIFQENPQVGIAGGFAYEKDTKGEWKRNHPMNNDHVRGAFKSYSKSCFKAIGGLKAAMGWDTVDELLALFHGFAIYTDETLRVKHLRPIGAAYNKRAKFLQGEAMYALRYGLGITIIASLKMALKSKKLPAFIDNLRGYLSARKNKKPYIVSEEEGRFIRKHRWQGIRKKLF
ncbi:glycosyltransferase family 2 protein [Lentiprolixibacter aurantiacus]|uniref:Glycosyltransferase family A protein n=1 Tax=Lentiprolixibacter aurantiacus TaxID=2993939 RepID=A0AAE3MMX7_9FLAO|nr:glycosyltransferase family A protein [Lentiprolixibacter aurantiacus]MCX2720725.1 glycosyltransferase family A protein [Lentiprolixibacter aurantiacus]